MSAGKIQKLLLSKHGSRFILWVLVFVSLLSGVGLSMVVFLCTLLSGDRGWATIALPFLTLLLFWSISLRMLIYRVRV